MNSGNFDYYSRNGGSGRLYGNNSAYHSDQHYKGQSHNNSNYNTYNQGKKSQGQQSYHPGDRRNNQARDQENHGKIELTKVQQQNNQQKKVCGGSTQGFKQPNAYSDQSHHYRQFNEQNNNSQHLTVNIHPQQQTPPPKLIIQQDHQQFISNQQYSMSMSAQSATSDQLISQQQITLSPEISTPQSTQLQSEPELTAQSMFSTPKVDIRRCMFDHPLSLNCLRKCAQWSLAIKVNTKKIIKVPHSAIALRQNGSIEHGPTVFTQDIIDALIQQETLNQCTQAPPLVMNNFSFQNVHLKQFNGFIHRLHQSVPVQLPLNVQGNEIQSACIDILKDQLSEQMFCLEFDITKIPLYQTQEEQQQSEDNFRIINQQLVESTIHFFINGQCHGQRILTQDLHFSLQGKKIIKSLQQRFIDYKEHIQNTVLSKIKYFGEQPCNCPHIKYCNHQELMQVARHLEFNNNIRSSVNYMRQLNAQNYGPYLLRTNTLHAKMLNITKSIAVEVTYDNLPNIENFLTNFNQIVIQEGVINKFLFCFDLPFSKLASPAASNFNGVPMPSLILDQQTLPCFNQILKDCSNQQQMLLNNSSFIFQQQHIARGGDFRTECLDSAKPLNLLEEFKRSRANSINAGEVLNDTEELNDDKDLQEMKRPMSSNSSQSTNSSLQQENSQFSGINFQQQNKNQQAINNQVKVGLSNSIPSATTSTFNYTQQQPFTTAQAYIPQQPTILFMPQQQYTYQINQYHQFAQYPIANGAQQPAYYPQLIQPFQSNTLLQQQQKLQHIQQPQMQKVNNQSIQLSLIQNYSCNLDRFINYTTPAYALGMTLQMFFEQYTEVALHGLKLVLYDQITNEPELLTFIPTLSSLSISYYEQPERKEQSESSIGIQKSTISDINDTNLLPKAINFNNIDACSKNSEQSASHDSINLEQISLNAGFIGTCNGKLDQSQLGKLRAYEFHEDAPNYSRNSMNETIEYIFSNHPKLLRLELGLINSKTSWFAIVWTLIKSTALNKDHQQTKNQVSSMPASNGQQFLAVYRFESDQNKKAKLVGLLSLKSEDEYYWISPIDSDSEFLERQNRKKMQRLRDQVMTFFDEEAGQKTYDYNTFVDQMNAYFD